MLRSRSRISRSQHDEHRRLGERRCDPPAGATGGKLWKALIMARTAALPILTAENGLTRYLEEIRRVRPFSAVRIGNAAVDRKSTRLNSSHRCNSYAVLCLKKKT